MNYIILIFILSGEPMIIHFIEIAYYVKRALPVINVYVRKTDRRYCYSLVRVNAHFFYPLLSILAGGLCCVPTPYPAYNQAAA